MKGFFCLAHSIVSLSTASLRERQIEIPIIAPYSLLLLLGGRFPFGLYFSWKDLFMFCSSFTRAACHRFFFSALVLHSMISVECVAIRRHLVPSTRQLSELNKYYSFHYIINILLSIYFRVCGLGKVPSNSTRLPFLIPSANFILFCFWQMALYIAGISVVPTSGWVLLLKGLPHSSGKCTWSNTHFSNFPFNAFSS